MWSSGARLGCPARRRAGPRSSGCWVIRGGGTRSGASVPRGCAGGQAGPSRTTCGCRGRGSARAVLWYTPGGGVRRVFSAYLRPGSGPDAAVAAARACLVEAMLTPQIPCLSGGGFICILEGRLLAAGLRPSRVGHPDAGSSRQQRTAELSDWLLLNRPASWSRSGLTGRSGFRPTPHTS